MMPGDTNTGKWHTTEFSDKIINKTNDTVLGLEETVLRAGRNCYGTVIDLFANVSETLFTCQISLDIISTDT